MSRTHDIRHHGNPWPLVERPSRPTRVIVTTVAVVALVVVISALAPLVT